jgi:hypothetical protein
MKVSKSVLQAIAVAVTMSASTSANSQIVPKKPGVKPPQVTAPKETKTPEVKPPQATASPQTKIPQTKPPQTTATQPKEKHSCPGCGKG